jgi:hypothetical protein
MESSNNEKDGQTPASNHRAHPRSGLCHCLQVRADAHITADRCATDAYRDSCGANESTAHRRTNHRTADTHRVACYGYKPTTNHRATDGGG